MIYIASVGVARSSDLREATLEQLVFRASSEALKNGGISREDVDSLSLAASDQLDGRAISTMLLAAPAGGYLVDEIRCTEDGSLALAMAAQRIRSGVSNYALAVSWTKSTESPVLAALGVNAEPIFTRPVGLHPFAMEALEVQRFLRDFDLEADQFDDLANQRRNLVGLPTITRESNTMIALPIKTAHVPSHDDVAVAVLLTNRPARVQLLSFSYGVEQSVPMQRIGSSGTLLRGKAKIAYERAELTHPERVRVVESTDHNVFRLAMNVAGLGLATGNNACRQFLDGNLTHVNSSGGLWQSYPYIAAGLEVTARAYDRLQDVNDLAICHSSFGMAGNGQAVWVMKAVA